jgi:diguanylate cyclase (GGDEF)-like protein
VIAAMRHDDGSLQGMLTIARDVTREREKSEQLKWASEHDALTHLPNRRAFQSRLQAAVLRAMESGGQIGLLLIDLDHFKHVNDSLGHSAGDDLLKSVAERLRGGVREEDFVARIGGDEFAIVLENLHSEESMLRVGDELQLLVQSPMRIAGRAVRAGASIGGALFPRHASSADDLFKNADTALYALKQDGRGGTRLFDFYMLDEAERSASQLRLARSAVTDRTVVPVYQPQFDIVEGTMSGLEALLRWRHPRKGLQLPGTLEEAFGDYELAAKIGEMMQRKVAADIRSWLDSGLDFGRVAINAAPAEFLRDDYAEHLLATFSEFEVPTERLEIEITEHAFLGRANEYVARALGVLKDAGVTIALDDFGTGASSLSHLRDFPVDVAKIDMSFVQQMTEDDEIAAIVTAVVRLASSLSIEVVAEGVEKPAQLELLRAMGCRFAQGHLFTAAVEADAIGRMVAAKRVAA